jgi:hypothetical protein
LNGEATIGTASFAAVPTAAAAAAAGAAAAARFCTAAAISVETNNANAILTESEMIIGSIIPFIKYIILYILYITQYHKYKHAFDKGAFVRNPAFSARVLFFFW